MTCPHRTFLSDQVIKCEADGFSYAAPGMPHERCGPCIDSWVDGQPPEKIAAVPPVSVASLGLGDTVAKALAAVGIRKRRGCGCTKRQAWLNKMFPYGH